MRGGQPIANAWNGDTNSKAKQTPRKQITVRICKMLLDKEIPAQPE
jgi:hypothetical protein